jgi:hypothetical protein
MADFGLAAADGEEFRRLPSFSLFHFFTKNNPSTFSNETLPLPTIALPCYFELLEIQPNEVVSSTPFPGPSQGRIPYSAWTSSCHLAALK